MKKSEKLAFMLLAQYSETRRDEIVACVFKYVTELSNNDLVQLHKKFKEDERKTTEDSGNNKSMA